MDRRDFTQLMVASPLGTLIKLPAEAETEATTLPVLQVSRQINPFDLIVDFDWAEKLMATWVEHRSLFDAGKRVFQLDRRQRRRVTRRLWINPKPLAIPSTFDPKPDAPAEVRQIVENTTFERINIKDVIILRWTFLVYLPRKNQCVFTKDDGTDDESQLTPALGHRLITECSALRTKQLKYGPVNLVRDIYSRDDPPFYSMLPKHYICDRSPRFYDEPHSIIGPNITYKQFKNWAETGYLGGGLLLGRCQSLAFQSPTTELMMLANHHVVRAAKSPV